MTTFLKISEKKEKEFIKKILNLKKQVDTEVTEEKDAEHLERILKIDFCLKYFGYFFLFLLGNFFHQRSWGWTILYLVAIFLISCSRTIRWTLIAHHVLHGAFDLNTKVAKQFCRTKFAKSLRRFQDWIDWLFVEGWTLEHNKLHHNYLNEQYDPDLLYENTKILKDYPIYLRIVTLAMFMMTWRWTYFAANNLQAFHESKNLISAESMKKQRAVNILTIFYYFVFFEDFKEFFFYLKFFFSYLKSLAPFFFFGLILPVLVLTGLSTALGATGAFATGAFSGVAGTQENFYFFLKSMFLTEVFTNLHTFIIITTNHCGKDVPMFSNSTDETSNLNEFRFRAIVASVNFSTGNDFVDVLQGGLNYQIEHHFFPNLSMLKYRHMQKKMKKICEEYEIPYIQENIFLRLWKTIEIILGFQVQKYYSNVLLSS